MPDWRLVGNGSLSAYTSRLNDEDGSYDDGDDNEQEDGEGEEATLCPLGLGTTHGLNELLSLRLALGGLPFLWWAQRRDEEEGSGHPEEREHCDDTYVSRLRV